MTELARGARSWALAITIGFTSIPALATAPVAGVTIQVPAGIYVPLFPEKRGDRTELITIPVPAFKMDATPVSEAEFQAFVKSSPEWRRSRVNGLFADKQYLSRWKSDLVPGTATPARSPVTQVSWHASQAYCVHQGKTLPTIAQWEVAAGIDLRQSNAKVLEWYSRPVTKHVGQIGSGFRNSLGIQDLHGLIWEWTTDFNSQLVTGESRGDSALERGLFCGASGSGAVNPEDYAAFMRSAMRSSLKGNYTLNHLGFRCVEDPDRAASAAPIAQAKTTVPPDSIYRLRSTWRNTQGQSVTLDSLRGKVRIMTMIYTRCKYSCPLTMRDLKAIEAALPADVKKEIGFVLVSFDSENDEPATMKAFSEKNELDPTRWELWAGKARATRELATTLELSFRKSGDGDFSHTSSVSILDSSGRIFSQKMGIGGDLVEFAARAAKLVKRQKD